MTEFYFDRIRYRLDDLEKEFEKTKPDVWHTKYEEALSRVSELEIELREVKQVCADLHTSRAALALRLGKALNVMSRLESVQSRPIEDWVSVIAEAVAVVKKESELD